MMKFKSRKLGSTQQTIEELREILVRQEMILQRQWRQMLRLEMEIETREEAAYHAKCQVTFYLRNLVH